MRVIARLNIGGPAIQAITLTRRLEQFGYRTILVRGQEEPDEGSMDYLADELGVHPLCIASLRRNPGWHDPRAIWTLTRLVRRERPHIVHTHAAKGGTLGRVATVLAFPVRSRRPALIHTYHGHSLSGYFSPGRTAVYRTIERVLARVSDRLIAISDEVRDELVGMGVADPAKFAVVPLGFDLSPFQVGEAERRAARVSVRAELELPTDAVVVTLVARLVPIKRVDRFLRLAAALSNLDELRFLIVGDGKLRESLQTSPEARALGNRLVWAGFRRDMPAVLFASDVVVQTSDNEGTPVSLIEAQAAGRPAVSTRVGGVAAVVADGVTGFVVDRNDPAGLAQRVRQLIDDRDLRSRMGRAGAARAGTFSIERLVANIDELYRSATGVRLGARQDEPHGTR